MNNFHMQGGAKEYNKLISAPPPPHFIISSAGPGIIGTMYSRYNGIKITRYMGGSSDGVLGVRTMMNYQYPSHVRIKVLRASVYCSSTTRRLKAADLISYNDIVRTRDCDIETIYYLWTEW